MTTRVTTPRSGEITVNMKKLLAGLLLVALTSLGLVTGTASTASAVNCNTYPGCVVGKLRVNKITKVRFGQSNKFRVRVTTPGNLRPTGTIALTFKRKGGGFKQTFKVRPYTGTPLSYTTTKLKVPGRYKIIATFKGNAPFGDLKNAKKNFVVKPKGF